MSDFIESMNLGDIFEGQDLPENLFIFPLGKAVVFPEVMMPIVVPPGKLLELVKRAQTHSDYLGFLWGADINPETVKGEQLSTVGCVGRVIRTARLPDGSNTILVHCTRRFKVVQFLKSDRLIAEVRYLSDQVTESREMDAIWRNIQRMMEDLTKLNTSLPKEILTGIINLDNPSRLADMIAVHFPFSMEDKQRILETLDVHKRLEEVYALLVREMDLVELGQKIHEQIRERIEESQREFFLREQLSAIRKELGEEKDERGMTLEEYSAKIEKAGMTEEATERAKEQLDRLSLLTPEAAEYNMIRTYLDWLCDLPWSITTEDNLDLVHAEKVLAQDHYGLEEIKERIVEFLAVKKLKPDHQGQIL